MSQQRPVPKPPAAPRWSPLACALAAALLAPLPAQAVPVGTSADTRPAAPQQRRQWKEFGWSAQITGNALAGNVNLTTLNTALAAGWTSGAHQVFVDAGSFYQATNTATLVNRLAGSALYAYAVADDFNMYGYTTHSRDASIQLDYRLTAGLGGCRHRLFAPAFSLFLLSVNPAFEYERFAGGVVETAWRGVLRLNTIRPLNETWELGLDSFYTPNVADPGDYRLYGEAYLRAKVVGDSVAVRVTVADEYDARPKPGVQPNDLGVFTTLELGWGR